MKLMTGKPQRGYVYGDLEMLGEVSTAKMKKRTFKQRKHNRAKAEKNENILSVLGMKSGMLWLENKV